jgi:hypothetical protein
VIQVFWGMEIKDSQEKYLSTIKSAKDIDVNVIYEDIINQRGEILVTILNDEKLADRLGREVLRHFRN